MKWRRQPSALSDGGRLHRVRSSVAALYDVGSWGYLALISIVAISRLADNGVPTFLQPLQAGLPILFAPVWLVLCISGISRRWFQVPLALVLAVTHFASVAPARQEVGAPYWVRSASTVRLAVANVFVTNQTVAEAAQSLLERQADVMILLEFTERQQAALQLAGAEESYPFRELRARNDPSGVAIFSKIPFDDMIEVTDARTPAVRLKLPAGEFLRVVAVHPYPPTSEAEAKNWTRYLQALKRFANSSAGDDPLVLAGDFNGTRWQPSFGKLLAGSMIDAHEALGQGLSRSWPVGNRLPRLVRLDHALVNERAFPTQLQDFTVTGSDHRGFDVTIAIKKPQAPGIEAGEDSIVSTTTKKPKKLRKR